MLQKVWFSAVKNLVFCCWKIGFLLRKYWFSAAIILVFCCIFRNFYRPFFSRKRRFQNRKKVRKITTEYKEIKFGAQSRNFLACLGRRFFSVTHCTWLSGDSYFEIGHFFQRKKEVKEKELKREKKSTRKILKKRKNRPLLTNRERKKSV